MPTILADSCSNLTMNDQPSCGNRYGKPYKLALMHHDGAITKAGTVPTVDEMETAIALGSTDTTNQMIIVQPAGCTREESGAETIPAEQTLIGAESKYSQTMNIAGNFVEVDEALRRKFELLGQNAKVRVWIITDGNYLFGEDGYLCTCDVDKMNLGTTGGITPFSFKYVAYKNETDTATQDVDGGTAGTGYKGLTNYSA